jgi:hypothetical protein
MRKYARYVILSVFGLVLLFMPTPEMLRHVWRPAYQITLFVAVGVLFARIQWRLKIAFFVLAYLAGDSRLHCIEAVAANTVLMPLGWWDHLAMSEVYRVLLLVVPAVAQGLCVVYLVGAVERCFARPSKRKYARYVILSVFGLALLLMPTPEMLKYVWHAYQMTLFIAACVLFARIQWCPKIAFFVLTYLAGDSRLQCIEIVVASSVFMPLGWWNHLVMSEVYRVLLLVVPAVAQGLCAGYLVGAVERCFAKPSPGSGTAGSVLPVGAVNGSTGEGIPCR